MSLLTCGVDATSPQHIGGACHPVYNLEAKEDLTTKMLTLRELSRSGSGHNMKNWTHVWKYEVQGLPTGELAEVAEMNHCWKYLRISNGNQGKWTGNYDSPEAALAGLQAVLKTEGHSV